MNNFHQELISKGFVIYSLSSNETIQEILDVVNREFKNYEKIKDTDKFREKLVKCQDKINIKRIHEKILMNDKSFFEELLNVKSIKELSISSVVYLRGVRPNLKKKVEFIDYHRESLYNDYAYINKQINLHFPIKNYNNKTAMKYFEKSHTIPDSFFKTEKLDSEKSGIERFSTSHKLGLPYNPKKIIGGLNPEKSKRCPVKFGEVFAFTSKLIHGGGINNYSKTRYSIDFGILKTKDLGNQNKKFHFASYYDSKEHFVPMKSILKTFKQNSSL